MKNITILGSTGSIGVGTLDVLDRNRDYFQVAALTAGKNVKLLQKQIEKFRPAIVAVVDKKSAVELKKKLPSKTKTKVVGGKDGLMEVASLDATDLVVSAVTGAAGLLPTMAAIDAGKDIALANKETMVMAGNIVGERASKKGVKILPVDSEHSAIFQCLQGAQNRKYLKKIILTASGGPFWNYTRRQLAEVNVQNALRHPNWKMGRKITIDSASLMNKGLEVIEARWLFNLDISRIEVLIHPQSIIHSLIELTDGSVLAQLGIADMRVPIAYALSYPERIENNLPFLDLSSSKKLEFYKPDTKKFPCLNLAYEAGKSGGTYPAVLNAANEIAVEAFLRKKIKFVDLPRIIDKILRKHNSSHSPSLEEVLNADEWARIKAEEIIEREAF